MKQVISIMRFILLAVYGLFFNGLAAYLILSPRSDYIALFWLIAGCCALLGLNAWYCLHTGKQAWLIRLGPLP